MKLSKLTVFLLITTLVSAVITLLLSIFANTHIALAFVVLALGSLNAVTYWRIRSAQATTTRFARRILEQISSLHSRNGHQFTALSQQLNSVEARVSSSQSDRKQNANGEVTLTLLKEKLEGQQALLQEIIVALDFADFNGRK